MGDHCLLAGSPLDAQDHYSTGGAPARAQCRVPAPLLATQLRASLRALLSSQPSLRARPSPAAFARVAQTYSPAGRKPAALDVYPLPLPRAPGPGAHLLGASQPPSM